MYMLKMIMQCASKNGYLDVVKFLVNKGANIHADDDGSIRLASISGHLDIVKFLVSEGANIHARDDGAVQWASYIGHFEVVKYLISRGADISKINPTIVLNLSKDEKFLSSIVDNGYCLDMTKDNLIVQKVKIMFINKIDSILRKNIVLIPNIRNIIYYY